RIPDPLKAYHAGSIENRKEIERLCASLWESIGLGTMKVSSKILERLGLAASSAGNWNFVEASRVCTSVFQSPFSLEVLLNSKAVFQAKRKIFLFGQTLVFVTRGSNRQRI